MKRAAHDDMYGPLILRGRLSLLPVGEGDEHQQAQAYEQRVTEILEDRHDLRSLIMASQLPLEKWHNMIGNPTVGDAILDRLVHNSHKISLNGDSLRKKRKTP